MSHRITGVGIIMLLSGSILVARIAHGQDLEPRRWTPLPPGLNVVGVGVVGTTGEVLFDPALQVEDASVDAATVAVSYVRSFRLAGTIARADVLLPWQHIRWNGLLQGQPASVTRVGLADPTLRLSMILAGGAASPSMPHTVLGAAFAVTLPLGEYFGDKLLNVGQNRFIFRPQLGVVHSRGPWSYEVTANAYLFTDNKDFFGGGTREQDPLYSFEAHIIRAFRKPGHWVALSVGFGGYGRTIVDAVPVDDSQRLFLSALSYGIPLGKTQGLKLAWLHNRTNTAKGTNTDSFAIGWSTRF